MELNLFKGWGDIIFDQLENFKQVVCPALYASSLIVCQPIFSSRMIWKSLIAALAFYTCIPVPAVRSLPFQNVARLAPVMGLLIGVLLTGLHSGLSFLGIPGLTASAIVVVVWIAITGGLHLDGAIDTADGLAVIQPERRLMVMTESTTGAFGVMAAVAILLLKVSALHDLSAWQWLILPLAAGWGRWGQQVAIGCYPYLKPTGKGALHQAAIRSFWDTVPSLLLLLGLSAIPLSFSIDLWPLAIGCASGSGIGAIVAAWFHSQLGGHTGDTYGAVVEWTEAIFLVTLTIF